MAPPRPFSAGGSRCRWLAFVGVAFSFLSAGWTGPASAQDPLPDFNLEWRWADFDGGSGFPGGIVEEMVEVGDTLWLRTQDRILWFAGYEWVWSGPGEGIPAGETGSVTPAGGGGVLVVVGGRVYEGGGGGFEEVDISSLDLDEWVIGRAVPTDDHLLVTARSRVSGTSVAFRFQGGIHEEVTPLGGLGNPYGLWRTAYGDTWLTASEGLLAYESGGWRTIGGPEELGGTVSELWATALGGGMAFQSFPASRRSVVEWEPGGVPHPVREGGANLLLSGTATTSGRMYAVFESGELRTRADGRWSSVRLPQNRREGLHFVFEDSHGDLWFGSARGLHLYRASLDRWTSFRYPFPDGRNRIHTILPLNPEEVWLATGDGLLRVFGDRVSSDGDVEISRIRTLFGQSLGVVTGLARDRSGAIWVTSGASFDGAYRWNGTWSHFGVAEGLPGGRIHAVHGLPDGSVWFMALGGGGEEGPTEPGVYRYADGRFERWMDDAGWLGEPTYTMAEGVDGAYWFGTRNGLVRWKDEEWSHWDFEDGIGRLNWARVFTILPQGDGGIWVGFGPGSKPGILSVSPDGSVAELPASSGAPGAPVKSLVRDSAGMVWVGMEQGVSRFDQGEWATLDGASGLAQSNVWPIAFHQGRVFIGTDGDGLRVLDRKEESNPPPQVRILGPISVQDKSVRVRWRAVAYRGEVLPSRVLTRDRFDDGEWSEWATFRELWTTSDSDLSWGDHRVEVQAKGLFGQVSEPLVAEFTIPFPIYLRAVFIIPVGGLILALGTILFLNRRRRVRSARILKASEQRLRTLVDSAPEALVIYDVDADTFVDSNQNALEMFGVTREQATEGGLAPFYPQVQPDGRDSRAMVAEFMGRALDGENARTEFMAQTSDGDEVPTEVQIVRFPSSSRRLVRISLLDVRAQKESERVQTELEEQLRQAQKLQAVGQLTGGVAHDFNNLLTVIIGNLELLQTMYAIDSEARSIVDGSMEAAERSALLTQRLLAFSRRQTLMPKPVAIEETVKGMTDLLARSLGETMKVDTHFEPGLWMALADVGQLEHALINLAVNARDAMPGGGVLTIEGANSVVGWEVAATEEVEPGDYVLLSVTDTGEGMEPAVASRVFDPFFTTKEVGKGSGLGLSMVYGFFKQLGGFVRLDTQPGQGTTVKLFLPRAETSGTQTEVVPPDLGVPLGNREMVLVVEDDPRLLKLTVLLCEGLNYRVLDASDGPSAMAILESDVHLDLLFTDVVLPGGMTGVDVAAAAREVRPDLKVAFTSGYADQEVLRPAQANPDFELLTKPFDRRGLARMLRRVLDA